MKPAVSGAASGVVIGISAILLLQQLALISLSDLGTGLTYLLVAALSAGVVFGVGGWLLGRSAMQRAKTILANEAGAANSGGPPKAGDATATDEAEPAPTGDADSAPSK